MVETKILDGRRLAADLRTSLVPLIKNLKRPPSLKVINIGCNPASLIYVKNKTTAARDVGIVSETMWFPDDVAEFAILEMIEHFNYEPVDGIMVQLPLPSHIRLERVIEAIKPSKDVDGFHPLNIGRVIAGSRRNIPCTPKGIMKLLEAAQTPLQGARALVVGCGAIVGRPVATLLTQAGATVTCAHLLTRDLASECRRADLIIMAAGSPRLLRGSMIREGVTIIDVGITRLPDGKICGDVTFDECLGIARAISPVPGGVGPMTVACLLENTVEAAIWRSL